LNKIPYRYRDPTSRTIALIFPPAHQEYSLKRLYVKP
jgi:hypothetical protein